jgi:hypothetical protein
MVRGRDRQTIFRDDQDRKGSVDRPATVRRLTGLRVLAGALLPDDTHPLVRTGDRSLSAAIMVGEGITLKELLAGRGA